MKFLNLIPASVAGTIIGLNSMRRMNLFFIGKEIEQKMIKMQNSDFVFKSKLDSNSP